MIALASRAWGAAFVPQAAQPDPPTGEVPGKLELHEAPAAGPTALQGVRWALGPVDMAGRFAIDHFPRDKRTITIGDVDFASYVWQPWFIQVRAGVGFVVSRDGGSGNHLQTAAASSSRSNALTGRVALSVFPVSRFPFEFRAEVGESRTESTLFSDDYRSLRLSLSQSYRPESGGDSYTLSFNHSRLTSPQWGRDTVNVLAASASRSFERHSFEASVTASRSERSDNGDSSSLKSITGRHGYQGAQALRVDTLASWHDSRFELNRMPFGNEIRQVSSIATWRPQEGDWLYFDGAPMWVTGTARLLDAAFTAGGSRRGSQQLSLSLGAMQSPTPHLQIGLGLSGTVSEVNGGESLKSALGSASISHTAEPLRWGEWRYNQNIGLAASYGHTTHQGQRAAYSMQLTHGLARSFRLEGDSSLSVTGTQSLAAMHESRTDVLARALTHVAAVSWQGQSGASQRYVSASFSDSRSFDSGHSYFQLANVQITQRVQLTRLSAVYGNFTAQGTRSDIEQLDPNTGILRSQSPGWQIFYHGSLGYENYRVFNVPRLQFSLMATASSQQVERRILGDIDASRERISHSVEGRFDYAIGRLQTRAGVRHARAADGRSLTAIFLRVQRSF